MNPSINIDDIDNIFLNNLHPFVRADINPFNFLYEQKSIAPDATILCQSMPPYTDHIPDHILQRFKKIESKLKINSKLQAKIDKALNSLNLTDKTIGVHIRLTDMDRHHGSDYGRKSFEDYVYKINLALNEEHDKIFIASDNVESIEKMQKIYGDKIIFYSELMRPHSETADANGVGNEGFQLDHFNEEEFWHDSFIDMFLLSKCGSMIHRVSNLSNAAKIYSNTFKKTTII